MTTGKHGSSRIVEYLERCGPATVAEIKLELGWGRESLDNELARLNFRGKVARIGKRMQKVGCSPTVWGLPGSDMPHDCRPFTADEIESKRLVSKRAAEKSESLTMVKRALIAQPDIFKVWS